MLPELYLTPLHSQLSASQLLRLEMLVWLLQFINKYELKDKVYQARSGIEAMFKDCKSGGYNLEDSLIFC
jgi:hypothetical protein